MDTVHGTELPPEITPEELEQTRKSMRFVFDVHFATTPAELDAALEKHVLAGAHFGPTMAGMIHRKRRELAGGPDASGAALDPPTARG